MHRGRIARHPHTRVDPVPPQFLSIRLSALPRFVSTSEVYGYLAYGPLKGVPLSDLVGDRQGTLIGNKWISQGETKCLSPYGAGAFKLTQGLSRRSGC